MTEQKEIFLFEEMEIKALVYLCIAQATMFLTFEASKFKDEVAARKKMQSDFMKIVDEHLDRKKKNVLPKTAEEKNTSPIRQKGEQPQVPKE